jgi:hypothetical protein
VRQGRTDAWIAHKLDIGVDELTRFKREHQLDDDGGSALRPADPLSVEAPEPAIHEPEDDIEFGTDADEEDDRPARRERQGSRSRSSRPPRRREPRADREERSRPPREDEDMEEADGEPRRRRRRGRRGGRRHRARRNNAFEATFDHGEEEGYGLWLDPAVVDNPVYTQHWAGHRAVTVTVEADAITIRRAEADRPAEDDEEPEADAQE